MSERAVPRLIVFLPPHRVVSGSNTRTALSSATLVHYVALEGGNKTHSGQTPIALLPKATSLDLIFDTADVFVTAVETPKISDAKLRLALPNLLEDRLLTETQDSHFAFVPSALRAPGTPNNPARVPVAVIDRGLLTRALDVMTDAGYRTRAAYSAIYTVPVPPPGALCVRVQGGQDVARSGKHEGFSFEFDGKNPPAALQLAVSQLGMKKIIAYGSEALNLARFASALGAPVEAAGHELDVQASVDAVNLLQGAFATGGKMSTLSLPRLSRGALRLPLIYAAVGAAVFVLGMNIYWLKLESEYASVRSRMDTSFRSTFPEEPTVSDAIRQTRQKMNALRTRAGLASLDEFSVLNAQTVQLMGMVPVGAVAGVEYRDGNLRVKFKPGTSNDPGLQNTLRAQAIQQGLDMKFEADGSARLSPSGG